MDEIVLLPLIVLYLAICQAIKFFFIVFSVLAIIVIIISLVTFYEYMKDRKKLKCIEKK